MIKAIFIPVICFFLLISCQSKKLGILNIGNLKSSYISIDADKAYNLKTSKGAVIKIEANSFDMPAGAKVDIEIKEAYNMQDILSAGLTTMSNGKPLLSGGMIYFDAATGGKPVKFLKEIGITIPSRVYDKNMQLFKGELKDNSTINWIESKKLDTSLVVKNIQSGNDLFRANCANCHKPLEDFTGPAMAGSRLRAPNAEWAYRFTNNSNSMIEYDSYARFLLAKYGSRMTQFNLSKDDLKAIFEYCDNEAALYKPALLLQKHLPGTVAPDSMNTTGWPNNDCGYDTLPVIESGISINELTLDTLITDTAASDNFELPEIPMYSFNIDQSGWYNIDCFIKNNISEVSDVVLTVSLKQNMDADIQVYLCIPSKKLLTTGSTGTDNKYVFDDDEDGKIKLILNADAFVLAVGTKEDKLYYGISNFTVKGQQHIAIDLNESTKEKILEAFKKNTIDGNKIDTNKPVIEIFIETDKPDRLKTGGDTIAPKVEMQLIKRPCITNYTVPVATIK
jgi:mono/diheme cytochrome c family protein